MISLTGVRQPKLTMSQAKKNPDTSLSTVCAGYLIHSAAIREQRHTASLKTKIQSLSQMLNPQGSCLIHLSRSVSHPFYWLSMI